MRKAIQSFLKLEAAGGITLMVAAAAALIVANSPWSETYDHIHHVPFTIGFGPPGDTTWQLSKGLLHWVNDGLMAIFFLLVGMELKREMMVGELSSARLIALPGLAAVGGMVVPALIFAALNYSDAVALRGWAIPSATDIAFALGVLSLAGRSTPISLRVFLTALAVLDDLGAIVVIAIFYTDQLSVTSLLLAMLGVAILWILNLRRVTSTIPYLAVGLLIWLFVLRSGVHATLAGVAVGLAIPLRGPTPDSPSPLQHLEHQLHPWVAFLILPIFAFFNAGVRLTDLDVGFLLDPIVLGIALGLVAGKQIGVLLFAWAAIRLGIARMPANATWRSIHAISVLCGIGFTMSLFIGTLAWQTHPDYAGRFAPMLRIGVLGGSLIAALLGVLLLRLAPTPNAPQYFAPPSG